MSLSLICFGGSSDGVIVNRSDVDLVNRSKAFPIKRTGFQTEIRTGVSPNLEYYDIKLIKYRNEFKEVLIKRNDPMQLHTNRIKDIWDELGSLGFDFDEIT